MSWWLSQARRAGRERVAIADLQENSDWLKQVVWDLSKDLNLSVNFTVTVGGIDVPLKLSYPAFFPDVPPQVYPIGDVRLSSHQYGTSGELCLEIRPDNWAPEFTGAMMIESAHRLLSVEQTDNNRDIPNAHRTTIAQDVRAEFFRLIISREVQQRLESLPELSVTEMELEEIFQARRCIARISRIGVPEQPLWSQSMNSLGPYRRSGYVVRLPISNFNTLSITYEGLVLLAAELRHEELEKFIANSSIERPILFVVEGNSLLVSLFRDESTMATRYKTIALPPDTQRQYDEYENLKGKTLALVGCGSIGSKVAASLSRAGVGSFVLVDGDILLPGNIVRNDLDHRSVGLNKPDAVMARIQEINPFANVNTRRILLGGQESSASSEAALQSIANCDVIVDATADATIFNLCAAVARSKRIPLVWGEVFAGGVGGLIARVRPDIDPIPLIARKQLIAWCADQGVPWFGKESDAYDLSRDDSPPLVADDAEVAIIAAHITRLAIDILVRKETIFPHSAYAVGLRKEWIFNAPFETFPIILETEGQWNQPITNESSEELATLMEDLFPEAFKEKDDS